MKIKDGLPKFPCTISRKTLAFKFFPKYYLLLRRLKGLLVGAAWIKQGDLENIKLSQVYYKYKYKVN